MKKLFFASVFVLGTLGMSSCGDKGATTEDGTVISTDTTVSEMEVQETVIDTDTTTNTETIETENQ